MMDTTFKKLSGGLAEMMTNNPFYGSVKESDKDRAIGYALAIEDALVLISSTSFQEILEHDPTLKTKVETYIKELNEQRTLRKLLGLPLRAGAVLVG